MATFTIKGKPFNTNGELPAVGSDAPDFKLTDIRLKDRNLNNYKGKKKVIYTVTSLDTDVCENSTKTFAEYFGERDDAVLLVVSNDLPFAQARILEQHNIKNVTALSEMRNRNFAKDYGVLIQDGPLAGLMARAVIIADEDNKVRFTQFVDEITQGPDYQAALEAIS